MIQSLIEKGTHIMVDIETLHNRPGAVIFEIGAVKFDSARVHGQPFHALISPKSCEQHGLRCGSETVLWWMKQGADKQKILMQAAESGIGLPTALQNFADWLPSSTNSTFMWGNSASFDLGLLDAAYLRTRIATPWLPWNERCFRTLKNLPQFKHLKVDYGVGHHSGVVDAIAQANHLIRLNKLQQTTNETSPR